MNLPLVAKPLDVAACVRDCREVSPLLLGSMSMLRMDTVSKRQSCWAAKVLCEVCTAPFVGSLFAGTGLSWW